MAIETVGTTTEAVTTGESNPSPEDTQVISALDTLQQFLQTKETIFPDATSLSLVCLRKPTPGNIGKVCWRIGNSNSLDIVEGNHTPCLWTALNITWTENGYTIAPRDRRAKETDPKLFPDIISSLLSITGKSHKFILNAQKQVKGRWQNIDKSIYIDNPFNIPKSPPDTT